MAVFISRSLKTTARWTLASVALTDVYTDFILSRQAIYCTPATLEFYKHKAGAFLSWVESQGVTTPQEVTARLVRSYLAGLLAAGRKDTTLYANARAIRTLVRFWYASSRGKGKKDRSAVIVARALQDRDY